MRELVNREVHFKGHRPRRRRSATLGSGLVAILLVSACSGGGGGGGASPATTRSGTTGPATKGADPGTVSAGDSSTAGYTPTSPLIADSGFRPDANGFHFENYGAKLSSGATPTNLVADDVRRMFGDGVCADAQSGKCDLNPEAQAWMDQANAAMAGGHCEGFSMASLLLWTGKLQPDPLGAPAAPAMVIDNNTVLQRQLAYNFMFQNLPAVLQHQVHGTPNEILNTLKQVLVPHPTEAYTLGIYKPDHTGGHAVTPFAIEDKGGGMQNLLIYDNNYPGVIRKVSFDTNANSWSYEASTNPNEPSALYTGDASTPAPSIELDPAFPGLGTQPCPFCGKVPASAGNSALRTPGATPAHLAGLRTDVGAPATDEIWLQGSDTDHAHLLIADDKGGQIGFVNGAFVSKMPGATAEFQKSDQDWRASSEPTYYVPDGVKYTITVDGTNLQSADDTSVGVIGSSFDLSVDGITMNPGEKDTLVASPDATQLAYTSSRAESPTLSLAVSDTNADYTFEVMGLSDVPGSTTTLKLPAEGADLVIDTGASTGPSNVTVKVHREDGEGVKDFIGKDIQLAAGEQADLAFGSWTDPSQPPPIQIKHAGG